MRSNSGDETLPAGLWFLLAGLSGGLAEVLWVMIYSALTPVSATVVAREVTASLFPALAAGAAGIWAGIAIHMMLAVALGLAFACVIWKPRVRARGPLATLAVSVAALAAVWAMNFFVVLPVLNPVFITLMPYAVTFASKMLFALAMAGVLAGGESLQPAAETVSGHPSV